MMWFNRYKIIKQLLEKIMADIATLKDLVAKQTTVIQSAVVLINGLHQQLKDVSTKLAAAGADTTGLDEVAASLAANTQGLADSVVANTDAAPPASPPA